jgi:hypothetical protein
MRPIAPWITMRSGAVRSSAAGALVVGAVVIRAFSATAVQNARHFPMNASDLRVSQVAP